jgi:predicted MFS family arabinose efflux permease
LSQTQAPPNRRWAVFGAAALLFVLSQFYRAAIAVITPQLAADFGLDARGLSRMSAAFFYAFALMQIPIAVYLDRIGARIIMTVLNLAAVAGALMFAAAGSADALVAARLLLGAGMACNLMGTFKLIAALFPPAHFATLTTVVFSMGTAGNIVATTPLVVMAQALGWRLAFVSVAAVNLALTAVFMLFTRSLPMKPVPTATAAGLRDTLAGLIGLFRIMDYWIISTATFCRYGIYAAIQTLYAGPYLMQVRGLTPLAAGNILLLMNLGFVFGGPLFGLVSDRWAGTRKWVVVPGLLGMALLVGTLAVLPPGGGVLPAAGVFFLLGLTNSTGGIMYTQIKERVPLEKAGTAMTGINFFTMIGPAVFLQGLGSFMQAAFPQASLGALAYRSVFLICSVCLTAVGGLYLLTADAVRRQWR